MDDGGDLLPNLLDDIKLAENLYKEDRISEAHFLLKNIEQFSADLDFEIRSAVDNALSQSQIVEDIRKKGTRLDELLTLFGDQQFWNVWNSGIGMNQDVIVSTHKEEQKGQYYFKVEGTVRCEMLHVIAALLESDLYKFWMPLCGKCETIHVLSGQKRVVKNEFDFALLKKEAISEMHADILPDGSVLVEINSLTDEDLEDLGLPGHGDSATPRLVMTGAIMLTEERREKVETKTLSENNSTLGKKKASRKSMRTNKDVSTLDLYNISLEDVYGMGQGETKVQEVQKKEMEKVVVVKLLLHIDPNLGFTPDWIFNMAVRSAASMMIPMLEHQAKLFGPGQLFAGRLDSSGGNAVEKEKGKNAKNETNIYEEIMGRIREFWENKAATEAAAGRTGGT